LGDSGAWLHNGLCGDEVDSLLDDSHDDWNADCLTEAYIEECYEKGVMADSDFESEDDYQGFQNQLSEDFLLMITGWRTAVIDSIERAKAGLESL
jgi:hypothetical protein